MVWGKVKNRFLVSATFLMFSDVFGVFGVFLVFSVEFRNSQ